MAILPCKYAYRFFFKRVCKIQFIKLMRSRSFCQYSRKYIFERERETNREWHLFDYCHSSALSMFSIESNNHTHSSAQMGFDDSTE